MDLDKKLLNLSIEECPSLKWSRRVRAILKGVGYFERGCLLIIFLIATMIVFHYFYTR
jgi:hypothetical protein